MGLIQPLKDKHPGLSYADIIQMASAAAIEASGGPKIPMRYGRVDAETDAAVPIEGRLPDGEGESPPPPQTHTNKRRWALANIAFSFSSLRPGGRRLPRRQVGGPGPRRSPQVRDPRSWIWDGVAEC